MHYNTTILKKLILVDMENKKSATKAPRLIHSGAGSETKN